MFGDFNYIFINSNRCIISRVREKNNIMTNHEGSLILTNIINFAQVLNENSDVFLDTNFRPKIYYFSLIPNNCLEGKWGILRIFEHAIILVEKLRIRKIYRIQLRNGNILEVSKKTTAFDGIEVVSGRQKIHYRLCKKMHKYYIK